MGDVTLTLDEAVNPNTETELSVSMTAPSTSGSHPLQLPVLWFWRLPLQPQLKHQQKPQSHNLFVVLGLGISGFG